MDSEHMGRSSVIPFVFKLFLFLGFQLYVMLVEVFEAEKSRMRWYYLFAYGAPLLIVCVSCVVDPLSYGTERYCWLRADNFFIFSFVGPVIAVILVSSPFYKEPFTPLNRGSCNVIFFLKVIVENSRSVKYACISLSCIW